MKQLQTAYPLWHALLWIAVYVGLVNITSNVSAMANKYNLLTSVAVFLLGIFLFFYIRHFDQLRLFGFKLPDKYSTQQAGYFFPLFFIALSQWIVGFDSQFTLLDTLQVLLLMTGVGFVEEVLFRGFLYKAISKESGINRAVMISGITFGIGHIVNILQHYTFRALLIQITLGVLFGILLALIVTLTHSLIPGILFHILLNVGGTLTKENLAVENVLILFWIVLSIIYLFYLVKFKNKMQAVK